MDWNSLKYILAIAEQGSISAAARYLNITHSTVSRKLSDMEQDLGFSLFLRGDQGYQISDQGRPFLETAEKFQHQWLDLIDSSKEVYSNLSGKVRLTAPEDMAFHLIQPLIPEFIKKFPDIHLHLIADNRFFALEKREVDLAFRPALDVPEHLIARKIRPMRLAVYAHKDYPQSGLIPENTEDHILGNCDWLAHEGINPKPIIAQFDQFKSKIKYSSSSFLCVAEAIAQQQGIALLPEFLGENDKRLFCVRRLSQAEDPFCLWLLKHPDLRHSRTIKAVADFFCGHIQSLPFV